LLFKGVENWLLLLWRPKVARVEIGFFKKEQPKLCRGAIQNT
jgi:hypothetical protein